MFKNKYIKFLAFLSVFIICCIGFGNAIHKKSYAASSVKLLKLLEVEDELIENLHAYVKKLKRKFNLLDKSLLNMRAEQDQMKDDYETYLGNPLNSFRLIHRLHTDWRKWHHYAIKSNMGELGNIKKAHQMRKRLPTALDLEQACRGIDDLMSFYDLRPGELAAGNLSGYSNPETALSAQDCFAMGEFCLRDRKEDRAEDWFNVTLANFNEDKLLYMVNRFSRFSVHNTWAALLVKNQKLSGASYQFEKIPKESENNQLFQWINEEILTKRNCRTIFRQPSRLHCRYNSSTTHFTRIAPLKMEELSTDPYMVIYHDVIYDSEINWLLNTTKLTLSLVDTGTMSEFRASKDSNIILSQGKVVRTLEDRVTDMTGLSMEMSDEFSLINYGLGGHYVLHTDYHNYFDQTRCVKGDRLATVLFYLGDVDSGGATIFPMINVSVTPKKGSAVFWHNLHNSGDMNIKTMHSGCPVIVGSKYVLTKWINELPQMFVTPCIRN
ncbi:prolyl 4-hydroxylase subunit alpha-2-like isoform X1 [Drosophila subpulchrella]|uniref:prolyl 4-hydroxylase subunit alpha-2-like isoform X1 n=2 Tax=Drosophila subpulchrella TaxID=1486046 RepID=UPI0018A18D99|nr:prolyl 4-hydroxylase subunit alpha-2-like isoform X1 [Drosophila subpulchrella]